MAVRRASVHELADDQCVCGWGKGLMLQSNGRESDRYLDETLQVNRRGSSIVRLKALESREDIFCYLFFYLHRSFLFHLVIVTSNHCIIKSSSRCGDLWLLREPLLVSSRHRIVRKPLNHRGLELLLISSVSTDRLQAIESSNPWVVAGRPWGIEASSYYRSCWVVCLTTCDQLRVMNRRRVVVPLLSSSYYPYTSDQC